ncbi:MAG: SpoIID/LytB domain-containing protein, partial [Defluviitaleaceae bacterium]|nr:SpoIID/LytB domain-containing protein [Defluviitaleaceae bacterium]
MKVLLIALTILIFAAGCAGDESVGGRLPVLEFDWEEGAENGILFPVDFGELQRPATVLARIGDDRPISYDEVERMFEQAGLDTYYWEMWKQGDEMMSLGRAQEILASISPAGKGLYVTEDNRERPISNALWIDLFLNALDEIGRGDFIETINIIPFRQENRRLFTNMGIFNISNFTSFAPYFDMEIQIIHREREILAVIGLTDRTPVIRNAMILRTDMLGVTIFSGGVQRNFSYASGVPKLPEDTLIADLRISGSRIIATSTAERVIRGTIESVTGQYIELKEWGALPLCRAFAVYGLIGGEAVFKGPQDLLVGANIADFHISHGRVVAAVITRDISPTYIRVVLGTSGFTGLVHDNVVIRSSGAFTVRGGERTERIEPGAIFTVNRETNADFWGGARFYIAPENPAHRLEIVGLRRNHPDSAYPRYRGILEISPKNGGFTIVNELCLEEYLYAVVPSEMPTGHGLEAAKVQA